jgi:3-oxoacyl-[acyl-carrier protein] reductase
MGNLDGRAAVVTGASTGLGRALAIALARAGADVGLIARRKAQLEETASRVRTAGRRAVVAAADIGDPRAVMLAASRITRELKPDILINNAGQFLAGRLADQTGEAVAGLLTTVVTGTALVTQAFLPQLLDAAPGFVVNIGARVAVPGYPVRVQDTSVAYQTGKQALAIFGRMLRQEVSPRVRVSTLYLPAIASLTDLDDPDDVSARLYPGTAVLPLRAVAAAVLRLLDPALPPVEELVLGV